MKTFKTKWNHKAIEDDIMYMSKEGKSFVTAFRNMLKRELANTDIEIVSIKAGHYDLSGFLKSTDGRYLYVSYDIPRHGAAIDFSATGAGNSVLYRTAKNDKDFRGGMNRFSPLDQLPTATKSIYGNPARSNEDT